MELSATAKVILGLLAVEPRSGYDIKRTVDNSTRFFWAASYGQIYPELKRLAEAGLVTATEPQGERRRTVYSLTAEGKDALAGWLREPDQVAEMRQEGLLKVFFAALVGTDELRTALETMRDANRRKLEALRAVEPRAAGAGRFGPQEVLSYGLGMAEYTIDWCERALAELEQPDA
jgi:DNA-binding PadR family transcriptional regulator